MRITLVFFVCQIRSSQLPLFSARLCVRLVQAVPLLITTNCFDTLCRWNLRPAQQCWDQSELSISPLLSQHRLSATGEDAEIGGDPGPFLWAAANKRGEGVRWFYSTWVLNKTENAPKNSFVSLKKYVKLQFNERAQWLEVLGSRPMSCLCPAAALGTRTALWALFFIIPLLLILGHHPASITIRSTTKQSNRNVAVSIH